MKKFVCTVCGYVHQGNEAPEACPLCGVPASNFMEVEEKVEDKKEENTASAKTYACEHVVGIAENAPEDLKEALRSCFNGECAEVGMYLAMARVAIREGYPEVGAFYEKAAWEEAEHAAIFAELLGEVVTSSTKQNLEMRTEAEYHATQMRQDIATQAKQLNLDAIHDAVHEIGRDEARHGRGFEGLLKRYFK